MKTIIENTKRKLYKMFEEASPLEKIKSMPPSAKKLSEFTQRYKLSDLLPYEAYDADSQIYWNDSTVGILMIANPTTGLDESSLNVLAGVFTQGLNPGTTVQFCLYANPNVNPILNNWKNARSGEMYKFFAQKRVDYLRQGAWKSLFKTEPQLIRDYQLFISVEIPKENHFMPDSVEIENLRRVRESFLGVLSSAGIGARACHPDDLLSTLDVIFNPSDSDRIPLRYDENAGLIRKQAVSEETAVWVGRDSMGLTCNGFEIDVRPFSIRQFPKAWAGWSMGNMIGDMYSSLLRIPCPFMFTLIAEIGDPIAMGSKAKMKTARATQMASSPMAKYMPIWEERKSEWQFVTKLQDDGHRMIQYHWQGVIFPQKEDADFAEQRTKALFESRAWTVQRDRFIVLPAFLAALPMNAGVSKIKELKQTGRMKTAMSWTAVNTAPTIAEWKGTGSPLLMLLGRRGQVQMIDNFDNDKGNYNMAIAAASGAGKSFLTQEIVMSALGTGGRCWAIDSGRSYQNLCGLVQGDFLEFGPDSKICLNPFTRLDNQAIMEENLPLMAKLLEEMATANNQGMNALQMSFVQQAISEVWNEYGPETTITKIASWLNSNEYAGAKILGQMLHPYTKNGVYSRFFEGRATIELDNPFVVLELGELDAKRDLRGVVLLLLMTNITEAMYRSDRSQRKICIIDEAWKLMSSGNAGEFIEEGYRVARKFGGAFATVTQSIGDYYRSPISKAALDNSDWQFILRQKPSTLDDAIKNKQISVAGGLEMLLKSLDTQHGLFSEIAVTGPGGTSVGRLIVDGYSEKLYSTQAEEFQAIQDMQKSGMSLMDAISKLAEQGGRV